MIGTTGRLAVQVKSVILYLTPGREALVIAVILD